MREAEDTAAVAAPRAGRALRYSGAVDFVADNAVAIAAIIAGGLIFGALAVLGVTGLRLWRRARAAQRAAGEAVEALAREGERVSAAVAALPERQEELQGSLASLQARAAALATLARYGSSALQVLRAPLRYVGGR